MRSLVEFKNSKPVISVNGKFHFPLAYTTYFEECAQYSDFIKSGYKMFFVNVSFTDLPINNSTGFSPFLTGVFEGDIADYSEFDNAVNGILSECPDAMIFPRINIAMPRKWIAENPYETVGTQKGGNRESLFSDVYLRDGTKLLKILVEHIRSADYSDNIAGYQLCGGLTQEWMHHDFFGSLSDMGIDKFRSWMKEKYNVENTEIPVANDFNSGILSEKVSRYGEFCGEMTAKTVEHFVRELKNFINGEQIVGVFYGYNAFVNDYLLGLHGMRYIIGSPYIDFFSSPCCYDRNRCLGVDWGDMIPVDSVKLHGKLCFIECDIRTYLTRRMQDSRPGRYPEDIYTLTDSEGNKTAWCGPDSLELSLSAIRKAFAHQLTKGSGVWWFDMWGGWYHDKTIMAELERMKNIADASKNKIIDDLPSAQTVFFIDEKAYTNLARGDFLCHAVNITRVEMGNSGIPFDLCMVEDAEKVIRKYRAAIFSAPIPSACGESAVQLCKELNIPYIQASKEKPFFKTAELRDFLVASGVHCYNDDGCVVYSGNGYLGIHSVKNGQITVNLPEKYRITPLVGTIEAEYETNCIVLTMKEYDTVIFELHSI